MEGDLDGTAAHAVRDGFAVSRGRETRRHPPTQIRKLQASTEQFGFVLPIVIDATSRAIAGWGLTLAAKKLGLPEVPAVTIANLDEAKLRMLRLALNRLGEDSHWDVEALRLEFSDIMELRVALNRLGENGAWSLEDLKVEFEELIVEQTPIEISGFSAPEIDQILLGDDPPPHEQGPLAPAPGAIAVRPGRRHLFSWRA